MRHAWDEFGVWHSNRVQASIRPRICLMAYFQGATAIAELLLIIPFTKMLQKGGFLGGILYRLTWMLGKVVLKNSLPRWWCKMLITMVQSRKNNLKKQIHEGLTSQVNHHDCKIYRILWEKPSPNTIWKDHILHGVDWFSPSGANMKGQPLQSLMAIFGQILS